MNYTIIVGNSKYPKTQCVLRGPQSEFINGNMLRELGRSVAEKLYRGDITEKHSLAIKTEFDQQLKAVLNGYSNNKRIPDDVETVINFNDRKESYRWERSYEPRTIAF